MNCKTEKKSAALTYLIISTIMMVASANAAFAGEQNPASYVNPFIGSAAHGHTYPGATVPFGLVQLGPDTGTSGWDWCSGYHDSSRSIMGFSHTHLSGTGCGDLGDILFIPALGVVAASGEQQSGGNNHSPSENVPFSAPFSKKNESASAGYYKVKLDRDGGILVELTASERVGMHRYTFPKSTCANILVDLTHGISDKPIALSLNIVGDHTITGLRRSKGWAEDQYVYFIAEFSQPFKTFGTIADNDASINNNRQTEGKKLRGYLTFDTTGGKPIIAKVALSTTSIDGARRNLAAEVKDWDFDRVKESAEKKMG